MKLMPNQDPIQPNSPAAQNAANPHRDLLQWGTQKAVDWAFKRFLARALLNWKTTLGGLCAMLTGIITLVNLLQSAAASGHLDLQTVQHVIGEIAIGAGLVCARDSDKSTEQNAVPALPVIETGGKEGN